MPRTSFSVKRPDIGGATARDLALFKQDQQRLARVAMDRLSKRAQGLIQDKMIASGLGRLSRAVKQTSALKKGQAGAWGVVYAAGGDQSRAGQALDAYSNGVTITAQNRQWLAFQTDAIPRRASNRRRMTPALYKELGYETTLGKLIFRPISTRVALLVVRNTTVHVRSGRIKPPGKRKSSVRVPTKEIAVFVLIRLTVRGKRFDKDELSALALAQLDEIVADIDGASAIA